MKSLLHPVICIQTHRIFKDLVSSISTSLVNMAKSKFEYVKQFEQQDICLPNCWIIVRVDGKGFHKFTDRHNFEKPNDDRGLNLMSRAAERVMSEFSDLILAYGHSDEYSFIFKRKTETYNRRASKLMSNIVSTFASSYVFYWKNFFGDIPLQYPPAFDSRVVLYPTTQNLHDYISWRQADCHINNLYNTCFWNLVLKGGLTTKQAEERLRGTLSGEKNEILFSEFGINYNDTSQMHRKGTLLIREKVTETFKKEVSPGDETEPKSVEYTKVLSRILPIHDDIIGAKFWEERPDLLKEK